MCGCVSVFGYVSGKKKKWTRVTQDMRLCIETLLHRIFVLNFKTHCAEYVYTYLYTYLLSYVYKDIVDTYTDTYIHIQNTVCRICILCRICIYVSVQNIFCYTYLYIVQNMYIRICAEHILLYVSVYCAEYVYTYQNMYIFCTMCFEIQCKCSV